MKERIVSVVLTAVLTACSLSACVGSAAKTENAPAAEKEAAAEEPAEKPAEAAPSEEPEKEPETAEQGIKTYKNNRGWSVEYNAAVIKFEDNTDPAGEVSFIYTGENTGDNSVTVSFAEGKLPKEEIETIKGIQDSGTKVDVEGNIFPGTTDKWAYWLTISDPQKTDESETIILGEFKGGTLAFTFRSHRSGNDEIDIPVSDNLAMIIDSLSFDDFGPQTMYDGIPGIYTQQFTDEMEGEKITVDYEVRLADDHTGVLSLQDEIPVQWDDRMIRTEDGSAKYSYTLEGDKLTIDYDGVPSEFTRSDGEGRINPPVIVDMEKYESKISTLPKGSYIAFCEMFKDKESENDVLLVADPNCLFDNLEGGKACTEAKIYGIDKNGEIKEYGDAISGGTAYPLSLYEGCLYTGNHSELTRMYIDSDKDELVTEKDRSFDELDNAMELAFFEAE